jgi:hypothetical protein
MGECECLAECPFFNDRMKNMPAVAKMYNKNYCHDAYESCARYMVFIKSTSAGCTVPLFFRQLSNRFFSIKSRCFVI